MGPINFPVKELFYMAVFGLICAAVLLLGGIGFAIWFVINHVQIV